MPTDLPNDGDNRPKTLYQIMLSDGRLNTVTPLIFKQWTGRRFIDGDEWHAAMVTSSGKPYMGARMCQCAVCQEWVADDCKPESTAIRGPRTRK